MSDTLGKEYRTTPTATLQQQILDPNHPKNEREWWAATEITTLRAEVERLRQVLENAQQARVLQGGAIIEAINEIDSLQAALNADPQTLRLHLGEMSAQEMRTLRAGFQWVLAHAAKKEKR